MSNGISLILAERLRQMQQEGWTPEHDDTHTQCELLGAARAYSLIAFSQGIHGTIRMDDPPVSCPDEWDIKWWKPSPDPIRNLVKAGALIAAEIDRLQRKEQNESHS